MNKNKIVIQKIGQAAHDDDWKTPKQNTENKYNFMGLDYSYPGIAILATRGLGKTHKLATLISPWMKQDKNNKVMVFSETAHDDPVWAELTKPVQIKIKKPFTSGQKILAQLGGKKLEDQIETKMVANPQIKVTSDPDQFFPFINSLKGSNILNPEHKQRYMCCFDDFAKYLQEPKYRKAFEHFLKKARHKKCIMVFSSQSLKDLSKPTRQNIDSYLLGPNIDGDALETIHKESGVQMPLDAWVQMYQDALKYPIERPFFYTSPKNKDFRINWDKKIIG